MRKKLLTEVPVFHHVAFAKLLNIPIALLSEPGIHRLFERSVVYADEQALAVLIVTGRLQFPRVGQPVDVSVKVLSAGAAVSTYF